MTINDKFQKLLDIKQDIKEAIENKGADLTGVEFDGYAGKIDEIETGGGASGGYDLNIQGEYGSIGVDVKDINNTTIYRVSSGYNENVIYLKNITWVKLIDYGAYTTADGLTVNQAKAGHTLTQDSRIYTNHD